jgi:hypothetical protein
VASTASAQTTSLNSLPGSDDEIAGAADTGVAVEVVSTAAGDTSVDVTVYGLDDSDVPQIEVIATDVANGTTPVAGIALWNHVWGASIVAATGTISVTKVSAGANIITGLATGTLTRGLKALSLAVTLDTAKLTGDGATTKRVILVGTNSADAVQMELITLTGAVEVEGTAVWKTLTTAVLGEVEVARTVSLRSSFGDLTWSYNTSALHGAAGGALAVLAAAVDQAIYSGAFLDGLEIGSSCIGAIVIKNVAGTVSLDGVPGTPAVTGNQLPPSDAVIQAAVGASNDWVKIAHATINRTANASVTESWDNTVRPVLGVNVDTNFGTFTG